MRVKIKAGKNPAFVVINSLLLFPPFGRGKEGLYFFLNFFVKI